MSNFNPEIHHRHSIRLKNYNYSQAGAYFVTITAYGWYPLFGSIDNGSMNLNEMGNLAQFCWNQIPYHFENAQVDQFIVMPNHVHGIIILTKLNAKTRRGAASSALSGLSTIVRSYKSAVTKEVNIVKGTPGSPVWQRNYYEHVVRTDKELNDVRQYSLDNPVKWTLDQDNRDLKRG